MPFEAELAKLKELMVKGHSHASLDDRRKFQEHLLLLASLPSYETKAHFGLHIHKTFAVFDKDQDPVIDAVMDLCEDKDVKIRILGIRALRTTAAADPRWVKGNVGVLLQLLDSSGDELIEVHKAIRAVIAVDPVIAFQSIAKDLVNFEETGVSRTLVIRFLYEDAKDERRRFLERGDDIPAEKAFEKGFRDVLADLKKGSDDWKDVYDMLDDLSINRRRRSPSPRRKSSSKARPVSPPPPSRPAASAPSAPRAAPPRDNPPHQQYRQQPPAAPSGPYAPRGNPLPRGPSGPASYPRGPPAGPRHNQQPPYGRPPPSAHTSDYRDTRAAPPSSVGRGNGSYDRPAERRDEKRSDRSPRRDDRKDDHSDSSYRRRDDSPPRQRSDDHRDRSPDRRHRDSRRSRSRDRSPVKSRREDRKEDSRRLSPTRSKDSKADAPSRPRSLSPKKDRAPSRQPRESPQPVVDVVVPSASAASKQAAQVDNQVTDSAQPVKAESAPAAQEGIVNKTPTLSIRGGALSVGSNNDEAKSPAPAAAKPEMSIRRTAPPVDAQQTASVLPADMTHTSAPAQTLPAASNREASAKLWAQTTGQPAAASSPALSLADRMGLRNGAATSPMSLADRLGIKGSSGNKRGREMDTTGETEQASSGSPRPSLLNRMSSSQTLSGVEGSREAKKPRSSLPMPIDPGTNSLFARISAPGSAPSTPNIGPQPTSAMGAPGRELSIRSSAITNNGQATGGFSIRGATATPTPTMAPATDYFPKQGEGSGAAAAPRSMSIKAAGAGSDPAAGTPVIPIANPEEGIRRKGRGFSQAEEGPIIQVPVQQPGALAGNGTGQGGFGQRFNFPRGLNGAARGRFGAR